MSSEDTYETLLSSVYNANYSLRWVKDNMKGTLEEIISHLKTTIRGIIPNYKSEEFLYQLSIKDEILYSQKVIWEDIRIRMQQLKKSPGVSVESKVFPYGCKSLSISSDFIISKINNHYYLFDYDQVMMIADTIASRVFTILTCARNHPRRHFNKVIQDVR